MQLRNELTPSPLDEQLVAQLADLAGALDGNPNETLLAEFNKLAGMELPASSFQGVSASENHVDFVRRLLHKQGIKPVPDVTREELIEIVRRAMEPDPEGLIFYPADYDGDNDTWGGGKPICDYDPSPEQIVDWALDSKH